MGLLRGSLVWLSGALFFLGRFGGEFEGDVDFEGFLVDGEAGAGIFAEVFEDLIFAEAVEEEVGVVGVEKLIGLHAPDAAHFVLGVEVEALDEELAEAVFGAGGDVEGEVDGFFAVIEFALEARGDFHVAVAAHGEVDTLLGFTDLVEVGEVVFLESCDIDEFLVEGMCAFDGDVAEGVGWAFDDVNGDFKAFDRGDGFGLDLGEIDSDAAAGFVQGPDAGAEQLAEAAFAVFDAYGNTVNGQLEDGCGDDVIAAKVNFGDDRGRAGGVEHDVKLVGTVSGEAGSDGGVVEEGADCFPVTVHQFAAAGDAVLKKREALLEMGAEGVVVGLKALEAERVELFDVGDFIGDGIAAAVRGGFISVADAAKGVGLNEAILGSFESVGRAGVTDLESGGLDELFLGKEQAAFDADGLDGKVNGGLGKEEGGEQCGPHRSIM